MYIAMNRFRISPGKEADFEALWRSRESFLRDVPGFEKFHLLRGPSDAERTLYVSHSTWASKGDFNAWTSSEAFRKGHAGARSPAGVLLGHPELEAFEVVL